MELNICDKIFIQSFKHDGSLHRTWAKGFVVEKDDKRVVLINNQTTITEAEGRRWMTREPAVCFFYFDRWYNVIAMIRVTGVYYYCNFASPSIIDEEALKNIDYDLDIKVFPDKSFKILDENEYNYHKLKMKYPPEVMDILDKTKELLIQDIKEGNSPFNDGEIYYQYHRYLDLLSKKNG